MLRIRDLRQKLLGTLAGKRQASPAMRSDPGFILIAAIWMLILAGSVAAMLMLRARSSNDQSMAEVDRLSFELAADQATQTVITDLALGGRRSPWSTTPARGAVRIGKLALSVEVTSEAAKLDVNTVDLNVARSALAATKLPRDVALSLLTEIDNLRRDGRRLHSWPELEQIASKAAGAAEAGCVMRLVTISSSLQQPVGYGPSSREFSPHTAVKLVDVGEAVRMVATDASGRARITLVRITGQAANPYLVLSLAPPSGCRDG